MVLVLSHAHTKRTWLLLCFSSPCHSATNIKRVCPYMAGQMFALTAQSVCVCRWVCLRVPVQTDWFQDLQRGTVVFCYSPLDRRSLCTFITWTITVWQNCAQVNPELTNLCLSFCHLLPIWICVPLFASLRALYALMPPLNFALRCVIRLRGSIHSICYGTGAGCLPAWAESEQGAVNIKPTAAGKGVNEECSERGETASIPLWSWTMGLFAAYNGIWRIHSLRDYGVLISVILVSI